MVRVHRPTAGIARALPTMLTIAFVIRLFFSYLSLIRPPIKLEEKPHIEIINAV